MSVSRRLARPMLASTFINGGIAALRAPAAVAGPAREVGVPIAERIPGLPTDPTTLVRINAGVQIGAGITLSLGRLPRLSALLLLGSIVPTTLAGHRFWEEDDEEARTAGRLHFLKNLGLAGGLLLAVFDTDGAPSLGWRARRRAGRAASVAAARRAGAGAALAGALDGAGSVVGEAVSAATDAAAIAGHTAGAAGATVSSVAAQAASDAAKGASRAVRALPVG